MSEMTPEQPVDDEQQEQPVDDGDEPTPTDADAEEADLVTYKVIGRHRVDEVKRGGLLRLDPNDPRTERMLTRGSIALHQED